jgi:hypothetical protein
MLRGLVGLSVAAAIFTWYLAAPEIELHNALQPRPHLNPDNPAIVMIGDSHIDHADWKMIFNCKSIANFGITGDTSTDILERLPSAISTNPRFVFVMAGTNDPFYGVNPEQSVRNIGMMKAMLESKHIEYEVIAPPPLPQYQSAIDLISSQATLHVPFASGDLAPDGIHLRRSGYAKWRDVAKPIIRRFCQ